jgi:GT2 family glycosyltransferase
VTIHVVRANDPLARASLEYILHGLDTEGHAVMKLPLDQVATLDRKAPHVQKKFQHTPKALIDSWRAARLLAEVTRPGDVVLMSDRGGLGGIFALEQAAADPTERRSLWTVAADSAFLEMRLIAGTHQGLPLPLDSEIDWEITQYRWSERVIATSALAAAELSAVDVGAELVGAGEGPTVSRPIDLAQVWTPGLVSRRNRTGEILRAITSIPNAIITVSDEDAPDRIWTGSSWETVRHSRAVLGDRVIRQAIPEDSPGVIVLGDPYSPPDSEVSRLVTDGTPVVAPADSVASAIWPSAPTWRTSDDLVKVLTGTPVQSDGGPHPTPEGQVAGRRGGRGRAPSVSVGIPVFRDVQFLVECVTTILKQDMEPIEVLIIDDGSQSDEVDQELARVSGLDPRVQLMRAEHRGVCAARNTMIEAMTGESFVLVDSDDILLPSFIRSCANVMASTEVWAVATWTEFFGTYEAIEAKPPFDERVGLRENPIISTSALVDMRVRDAGIRFSDDLAFLYCEDWHFWSQIIAAGGEMGLVPEALVRHRVHPASGGYLRTELAHAIGRSRATQPLLS